ncbi:hypothetical protein R1flu_026780 [Riccia fluitans]|uniref:Cytochrome P450 n=1 Tax=Riccia fluitans TaxID=41844 RepID=A0ABD1XGY6_9MARC
MEAFTSKRIASLIRAKLGAAAYVLSSRLGPSLFTTIIIGLFVLLVFRKIFQRRWKLPPGPRNLPIIGAILSLDKEMHQSLAKHAEKYGPVIYFRLGSHSMLAVQSAEVGEELFKKRDTEFASRAHSTILYSVAKYFGFEASNMGFSSYTPALKQTRKICTTELLSSARLSKTEQIRWEEEGEMIKEVESLNGEEFELRELLHAMAMNVTCRMILGKQYYGKNVVLTKDLREFQELMVEMVVAAGKPNIGDLVPWLRWLDPQGLTKQFKALHEKQERVLKAILDDHKKARERAPYRLTTPSTASMDFVDILLSLQGKYQLSDLNIMATVSDLLLGATDSTLMVVQWAIIELVRHPETMAILQTQLDHVVGKDRALLESDLPNIPFLGVVVKETLRLHPPIPLLLPRMNEKQTALHGYDIPANTTVFVNVWAISRDERNWEKADQFIPERFMDSPVSVVGNHFKYTPFGAGRRQCVGVTMGMLMVERTLGSLVHAFDWLPAKGKTCADISVEERYGLVLEPKQPLVCRAVPRLPKVDVYYNRQHSPRPHDQL